MKKAVTLLLLFAPHFAYAMSEFQVRAVDLGESMSGNFRVDSAKDLEFKDPDQDGNLATSSVAARFVGKNFKIGMEGNGRLSVQGYGIGFTKGTEALLFNEEETEYAVASLKGWIGKPFPIFHCEAVRQIGYAILTVQDTCTGRVNRENHFPRSVPEEWTRYEFRFLSLERDDADSSVWLQYVDQEGQIAVRLHLARI